MEIYEWDQLSERAQQTLLQRPALKSKQVVREQTQAILQTVKAQGDVALYDYTEQFDDVHLSHLRITPHQIKAAEDHVNESVKQAIRQAAANIRAFHEAQLPKAYRVTTMPGIVCERQTRPIQRVGLYVPGGSAPLPSTVLMLAIPARIAGCPLKILCSPPNAAGNLDPHILYTADLCGIDHIYAVGGAQAIAAMAYGTDSIPKVDKIYGPGNAWVTEAKLQVAQDPDGATYDLPTGPSEVLILADGTAKAEFIAADLLAQAEHGPDAHAVVIATDKSVLQAIVTSLKKQLQDLVRNDIASESLKHARLIYTPLLKTAVDCANQYGAEHLQIMVEEPEGIIPAIMAAGSVFVGSYTPVAVGDFASGTNHVLPTYGYARQCSGLSLKDFITEISFQTLSQTGLKNIVDTVITMATVEGLTAHANSVRIRGEHHD